MIERFRKILDGAGLLSLEFLLTMPLILALFVTGAGFFFGKTCSPWTLRFLWSIEIVGVSIVSWRAGLKLLFALGTIICLTAVTFSYVGADALFYHFPMQDLLIKGWNPVFDSSLDKFDNIVGNLGLARYHTLFLPKLNALCGALVALALSIYTGDAFLNYVLALCLFSVAIRFAKHEWGAGKFASFSFAVICVFTTRMTSFFAGQADYVAYASICLAFLSAFMWLKDFQVRNLVMLVFSLIICMLTKTTGLVCGCLIIVIVAVFARQRRDTWGAVLLLGAAIVVIGASPLLTAWIQYGSPVYPSMTFNPLISPVDITADFTSNNDGAQLGYLARVAYAWVSPELVERIYSIVKRDPTFHPEFYVCGGVAGIGIWFNILLLFSVIALLLSKRSRITLLVVIIFFTSNLAPLKYIGHARYFPQIWIIPALAYFNLYYRHIDFKSLKLNAVILFCSRMLMCLVFAIAVMLIGRTVAYSCRMAVIENTRREEFSALSEISSVWRITDSGMHGYSVIRRMQQAGLDVSNDDSAPAASSDWTFLIVKKTAVDDEYWQKIFAKYPICDSPAALLKFPWMSGFSYLLKMGPLQR